QPDRATLDGLLGRLTFKASPTFAAGVLDALGQSTAAELGQAIVARWGQFTPTLRAKALDVLLRRPEWSRALLDGLDKGTLATTDLSAGQSQQLAGHPDKKIAARARKILARGGSLPSPDRQKVLDGLLHLTKKTGNAA